MTDEKILEVIEVYRLEFEKRKIGKIDYAHDRFLKSQAAGLAHCHGMLDQMVKFVHEGRRDKAFRWLGFIQGVLWSARMYPLEDLKNHNRPA